MFLLKVLFQMFILLSSNFVYSSDVSKQNVARQIQPNYKFNHPPLLENYQAIPVAVVYEGEPTIIEKSIKPTISTDASNTSTIEEVKTKSVETNFSKNLTLTASYHTENAETKVLRHQRKQKEPKSTINPFSELEIPVVVIYEPESKSTQNYNRNNRVNSSRQRIRERNRKRHQQNLTKRPTDEKQFSEKSTTDQTTSKLLENTQTKNENYSSAIPKLENKNVTKHIERNEKRRQQDSYKRSTASKKTITDQSTTKPLESTQTNKENYSSVTPKVEIKNITKPGKRTRERDPVVPIVVSENRVYAHTGAFLYSYEGGDGTKAFEKGELKSFGDDRTGESVVGGFSYKDKDGKDFSLTYTADENGYQPVGAHLPTPPPIPPAIAQALLYLATKTTSEPVTEPITKVY